MTDTPTGHTTIDCSCSGCISVTRTEGTKHFMDQTSQLAQAQVAADVAYARDLFAGHGIGTLPEISERSLPNRSVERCSSMARDVAPFAILERSSPIWTSTGWLCPSCPWESMARFSTRRSRIGLSPRAIPWLAGLSLTVSQEQLCACPAATRTLPEAHDEYVAESVPQSRDRVIHVSLRPQDCRGGCNPRGGQALGVR